MAHVAVARTKKSGVRPALLNAHFTKLRLCVILVRIQIRKFNYAVPDPISITVKAPNGSLSFVSCNIKLAFSVFFLLQIPYNTV